MVHKQFSPQRHKCYDMSFITTSRAMVRWFAALLFINEALPVIADIREIVKSLYSMVFVLNAHKPVSRVGHHTKTSNFEMSIQRVEQSGRLNGHRSTLSKA